VFKHTNTRQSLF